MRVSGRTVSLTLVLAAFGMAARAQVIDYTEDLAFDRPEAWGMKYFTSVTLLTGMGSPKKMKAGALDIGLELGNVPSLSREDRTIGFNGTKTEDLNKTSVFGRPRVTIGLPAKFSITAGFVPPVEYKGVKPSVFSLSLNRPFYDHDDFRFGGRLIGQVAKFKGDLTCPESVVGEGPATNSFGCIAASHDEVTQNYVAFEASAAWDLMHDKLTPFAALSVNRLDMEFQVDSRYQTFHDRSLLKADGITYALSGGAAFQLLDRLAVSGELFYTPLSVVRSEGSASQNDALFNVRLMVSYRILGAD
ncbi:MAG: hypothetical protein U0166_07970 [Acidobacteriota bacterium]